MQRSKVLSMRKKVHNNFGLEAVTLKLKINSGFFFPHSTDLALHPRSFEEEKHGKIGGTCTS